jgi:hypothetical protein
MNSLTTFLRLLKLFRRQRDQLLPLLENLVATLHAAGEGMEAAGRGSIHVSHIIRGGGAVPLNAHQVVLEAATAIDQCNQLIESAGSVIDTASKEIDSVKVPSVTATYGEVLGLRVVTGISFGEVSRFGPVADALEEGADNLKDGGTRLHSAAAQLRNLGQVLNDAGSDLDTLGRDLIRGGEALQRATEIRE